MSQLRTFLHALTHAHAHTTISDPKKYSVIQPSRILMTAIRYVLQCLMSMFISTFSNAYVLSHLVIIMSPFSPITQMVWH